MWRVPLASVDLVELCFDAFEGTEAPLSVGSSHRVTRVLFPESFPRNISSFLNPPFHYIELLELASY